MEGYREKQNYSYLAELLLVGCLHAVKRYTFPGEAVCVREGSLHTAYMGHRGRASLGPVLLLRRPRIRTSGCCNRILDPQGG